MKLKLSGREEESERPTKPSHCIYYAVSNLECYYRAHPSRVKISHIQI